MSNVGRPRTGLKACPHCGSTDRDSNGQCRCRNVLYRALNGAPKATADKARALYNDTLKANKGKVEQALAEVREEYPSLTARRPGGAPSRRAEPKKATAKSKKAAREKAEALIEEIKAEVKEPARYILVVDDFEEKPYARKDAAIKNGVRSGQAWKVTYKGKVVAQSDDLI